jgi:hypothetical protein
MTVFTAEGLDIGVKLVVAISIMLASKSTVTSSKLAGERLFRGMSPLMRL